VVLIPHLGFSQDWEIGLMLGGANYHGDLAPDITLSESHPAGGLLVKYNINSFFSTSVTLTQGTISGSDANHDHQSIRNLSFQSPISEFSTQLEFNFLPFAIGLNPKNFSPFVFSGLSFYRFEPTALYRGNWIELKPLDTEGRDYASNTTYSIYQVAIPIGGGFKFAISDRINFGIALGSRYTFTDYLDDVSGLYYDKDLLEDEYGTLSAKLSDRSGEVGNYFGFNGKQRGRSDLKDWYIFGGITLSYKIRNRVCYYHKRQY